MNGMIRRQDALAVEIETADVLPMREESPVSEETENQEVLVEPEADTSVAVEEPVVVDVAGADAVEIPTSVETVDETDTAEVVDAADVVEAVEAAETEALEVVDAADVVEVVEAAETEALEVVDAADVVEAVEAAETEASEGTADAPADESASEGVLEVGVNIEHLRMTEALLFAASEPLSEEALKTSLPEGADVAGIIVELQKIYESRGVTLAHVAGKWQFRTAPDLAFLLRKEKPEQKRLSRAAIETLAIIAYHQPVTRAEIEDIRGVMLSKGTLDTLMEVGWIKIRGRKRTPGRPVTYGTTEAFLVQFGLENIGHLPGMDELKAAGFLEAIPPSGLDIPSPSDQLAPDEDPYDGEEVNDLATGGADPFIPGSSAE